MTTRKILKTQNELYQEKAARRRALAAKPVEEKFEVLIKLQQITSTLARQKGRPYREPWNVTVSKHS